MARGQTGTSPWLKMLIAVSVLIVAGWLAYAWLNKRPTATTQPADRQPTGRPAPNEFVPAAADTQPAATHPADAADSPEKRHEAEKALEHGLALLGQNDLVNARQRLSEALSSGALSEEQAAACRGKLTEIAEKVVFGTTVFEGDPYSYRYVIRPGDTLDDITKRENLLVPFGGIQLVNRISNPSSIRSGHAIKLVKGPFDAIVTKHNFTLDLYQHGMFVKSYRVGLGMNGSTPIGMWLVKDRVPRATWTPPPTSGQKSIIYWGEPDYPLGKEGLWIALEGIDENTSKFSGFGLHGTNEPDSIGKQASLGCVRLDDASIAEVFALLMPGQSKVEIRP